MGLHAYLTAAVVLKRVQNNRLQTTFERLCGGQRSSKDAKPSGWTTTILHLASWDTKVKIWWLGTLWGARGNRSDIAMFGCFMNIWKCLLWRRRTLLRLWPHNQPRVKGIQLLVSSWSEPFVGSLVGLTWPKRWSCSSKPKWIRGGHCCCQMSHWPTHQGWYLQSS